MTVIAGRVTKNYIEISADSQGTWYWHNKTESTKLVRVNGLVIGGSGSSEESQLLHWFAITSKPATSALRDMHQWVADFYKFAKEKSSDVKFNNNYLIIFEKKLFVLGGLWVKEVEQEAIGSGMEYARAALYFGKSTKEACQVACDMTTFCGPPIETIRVAR